MKTIIALFTAALLCSMPLTSALAQDPFDDLTLNGVASFEQLRKEYYIGGIFLPVRAKDPAALITMDGKKRMEIRIVIDKWSPRGFAQVWNQAILINNDQTSLEDLADPIQSFVNLPQDDLLAGDRIVIAMDPEQGTTVSLNGSRAFAVKDSSFFDLLLNTWIGLRPPSTEFKNNILAMPDGPEGNDLVLRFENAAPQDSRKKTVAGWFKQEKPAPQAKAKPAEVAAAATGAAVASSLAPPSSSASVKAELAASKPDIPAPDVAIEKPAAAPAKQATENKAAQQAAAAKEKAAAEKAKQEAEKQAAEIAAIAAAAEQQAKQQAEQDKLLKRYRSNVMKLTYLNTEYPKRAMDNNQQGLVVIKIEVNRQGEIKALSYDQKTDHSILNKAAETAVKKSQPYPAVPEELSGNKFELLLPFNFKL